MIFRLITILLIPVSQLMAGAAPAFREDWKEIPWALPVTQAHVANPSLTLELHGPGKDGIKLCEELKQEPETKNIPVMILTVSGNRRRVMSAGADMYMNKLFSIDEFVSAVDRLTQGPSASL